MEAAYQNALRTVADAYEAEQAAHGGKSLARVATVVVNNGAFFVRLRERKPFLVSNLEKFTAWFREPENWPMGVIPRTAAEALTSIGRSPLTMPRAYRTDAASVPCEGKGVSQSGHSA